MINACEAQEQIKSIIFQFSQALFGYPNYTMKFRTYINPNVALKLHYITSIAQQPQLADNNRLKIRKAGGVYLSGRKL
jgi:hypothetical protein